MGIFLSSQYLTDVVESLKMVQMTILSQRAQGDAAWLQIKKIQERLDDMKITLYNKACSKCKSKVKEVLGATPVRKNNPINDLPPERQVLLHDLARGLIEIELLKSGNRDMSEADVNLTLEFFDESWSAKMKDEHKKTIEEYDKKLQDANEKLKMADHEKSEASIMAIVIQERLNKEREVSERLETERKQLNYDLQSRTREGIKLRAENTDLKNDTVVLKTRLDALNRAIEKRKESRDSHTVSDGKENQAAYMSRPEIDQQNEEVLQLRHENEKMKTIIAELQRNLGPEIDEHQKEINTDIPSLEEEEHLIEKGNAKYMKQMTSSVEEERLFEKSEMQTKMPTLFEIDSEMQDSMKKKVSVFRDEENTGYSEESSESAEINKLKGKLTMLQNENEALNEKCTSLSKTKSELERERAKEKQEMENALNEEIKQLQEENTVYVSKIKTATEDIDRLQRGMEASVGQIETLTEQLTGLSKTNNELEMATEEKQKMENSLNEQIKQLKEENAIYVSKFENSTEAINRLKTEMEASTCQIETVNEQATSLSKINSELKLATTKLAKEKEEMEDSLTEQVKQLREEKSNYVNKIESATEEIDRLKREMTASIGEIKTLKEQLTGLSKTNNELDMASKKLAKEKQEMEISLNEQMKQLEEENSKYVHKNENATEEINRLKRDMTALNEQMRQLKEENSSYSKNIENTTEESDRLIREITASIGQIDSLKGQLTGLSKTNNELEMASKELAMEKQEMENSLKEQMKQLREEKYQYVNKIDNASEEIDRLKREMIASTNQVKALNEKLTNVSQTNDELELASKKLTKEKEEMEDSLKEQVKQLQQENCSYVDKIENATEEIDRLKREMAVLTGQSESLKEQLTSLSKTNAELEMASKELAKEKEEMEDSLKDKMKTLQDENSSFFKQLSDSMEEMKALNRTVITISDSKNELEKVVNMLNVEKEELAKQVTHLQQMTKQQSSSVSGLQQENSKLKHNLGANKKELKAARKEIEQNQEQRHRLEEDRTRHVKEIQKSRENINTLKTDIAKLDSDVCRLEKDITTVTQSKDQLETIVQTLQTEKLEIRNMLTKQMAPSPDEKEDIFSIISGMQNNIDRLQIDLSTKTEELDTAVSELNEIKNRKKTVVLGLRDEKSGMGKTMVDMVSKELMKRLHGVLEREGINLTIKRCQTPAEIPNGPLVVLCLNMSRVGTNIASALEGIKPSQDVFVLILHNTLKDNLSSFTQTSLRITGNETKKLGGIMDMAFSSDSGVGVYDCDLNTSTIDKMAATLRKYAH